MKTSLIAGIVVIVIIIAAAAGFMLYHPSSTSSTTSSPSTVSVSSTTSSSTSISISSTSTSTMVTNTTPTPVPSQTQKFSIDGLFSPSNATQATGVSNYQVVSYVEVQNLNTLMTNLMKSGSSGMGFQPSTSNYLAQFKYFLNYSSPMYIEVLAHNSSSYVTVIAFNYNTSGKGVYVAQAISTVLGLYLNHSSTGSYNGLQYVYGVYEHNGSTSLPRNMTASYNVTIGVAYGYTHNGRAFAVITYGLPNDSSSAFNTLKIVSMRPQVKFLLHLWT